MRQSDVVDVTAWKCIQYSTVLYVCVKSKFRFETIIVEKSTKENIRNRLKGENFELVK